MVEIARQRGGGDLLGLFDLSLHFVKKVKR
jgi:hypothetical protein